MLIAFCGLPGAGKTTLARSLALQLQATYLRIDSIEEELLADNGAPLVAIGTGYRVAYAVAEDNLKLGRTVVADCVNPIRLTREAWRQVANRAGVKCIDVVVTCSDSAQHKLRLQARPPGSRGAAWSEILTREFVAADPEAIVIDTSMGTEQQSLAALHIGLQARMR